MDAGGGGDSKSHAEAVACAVGKWWCPSLKRGMFGAMLMVGRSTDGVMSSVSGGR